MNQHTGKKSSVAGQGELKRPDLTPYLASTTRLRCFGPILPIDSKNMEHHQEGIVFNLPFEHLCVDAQYPKNTAIFWLSRSGASKCGFLGFIFIYFNGFRGLFVKNEGFILL